MLEVKLGFEAYVFLKKIVVDHLVFDNIIIQPFALLFNHPGSELMYLLGYSGLLDFRLGV
jgi:hypothetical protein